MKQARYAAALLVAGVLGGPVIAAPEETIPSALGLVRYMEPNYPALLSHQGITKGDVTVAVTWDDEGKPLDVFPVTATHPLFAAAAVEAVQTWRLAPERVAGAQWRGSVVRLEFRYGGISVATKTEMEKFDELLAGRKSRAPVRLADLDDEGRALSQPMPEFPVAQRGLVKHARVVVHFYVDREGRVRAPSVEEAPSPEFAAEAVAAMRRWRFDPPRVRGRAVVVADAVEFRFAERNGS